jgi:hypothetical protein
MEIHGDTFETVGFLLKKKLWSPKVRGFTCRIFGDLQL